MRNPDQVSTIGRLKRRADFLRAAKGRRWHGRALSLQSVARGDMDEAGVRVGFTLTKKVGCAVIRNRARRRLREAVRLTADLPTKPGHDYVVIGRAAAIEVPFEALQQELARALRAVHDGGGRDKGGKSRAGGSPQSIRRER